MNLQIFIDLLVNEELQAIALHSIDLKTGFCSCNNINCTASGKHPKTFWRGKRNKLTGNEIRTLFSLPNTNFGVCTGWNETKKRNLVVVDIDSMEHSILSKMPKTFGYRTGKLGYHFWFWTEKQIKNSVSLVDEKVDVRATGGYVVVPGSLHKSGNYYGFDEKVFGEKILNLPDWIYELTKKETKNLKIKKEVSKTPCSKEKQKFYESISAVELKEKLHNNPEFKISEGTRNQTMFRILCLERSRGADKDALLRQAMIIYSKFENKENFSKNEIYNIVNSAYKYIPTNTKYKRVNEGYVKWLEKNKISKPENFLEKLLKLDNDFFSCLKFSENGIPLKTLLDERLNFFKKNGVGNPSNYTTDYFSRKLKDLGFTRKRTKSCNLWLISLDEKMLSDIVANMTTETTKVKIKVKEHPRSMFYLDKQTSEYTMSSLKYLGSLTKKEGKLLQEGKLVKNKDNVKKFLDEVAIEDVIGYKFSHYKVVSKDLKNGLVVSKLRSNEQDSISISDIDFAQQLDRCEILYRNDKPYGIDEFKEVNLIIKK